jgi:hypothetical protein
MRDALVPSRNPYLNKGGVGLAWFGSMHHPSPVYVMGIRKKIWDEIFIKRKFCARGSSYIDAGMDLLPFLLFLLSLFN